MCFINTSVPPLSPFQIQHNLAVATSKLELLKTSLELRLGEILPSNTSKVKTEALRQELLTPDSPMYPNVSAVRSPPPPSPHFKHYSMFKPAAVTGKLHVR